MKHFAEIPIASLAELDRITANLAAVVSAGTVIGLSGPLGAGKTEFVRHFLSHLGVRESVVSPTFILESRYECQHRGLELTIYHWDLYRLGLGAAVHTQVPEDLHDCFGDTAGIVCIEWPEQVPAVLDLLDIRLVLAFEPVGENPCEDTAPSQEPRRLSIEYRQHPENRSQELEEVLRGWLDRDS